MQISSSNELVFNGAADQDALYEINRAFKSNYLFGDIGFDEYVLRLQASIQKKTGETTYIGQVSPEELESHILEAEAAYIDTHGYPFDVEEAGKDSKNLAIMQKMAVAEQDVTYVLAPKWMPVVIAGSMIVYAEFKTRRDELFELMIDGSSQMARDGEKEITRLCAEDPTLDPLSPENKYELDVALAQSRFDRVQHVGEILKVIGRHFIPVAE